jgi:hypothetical protein
VFLSAWLPKSDSLLFLLFCFALFFIFFIFTTYPKKDLENRQALSRAKKEEIHSSEFHFY